MGIKILWTLILFLEKEKGVFPFTSVLAETGGTLGLFLGLSILEIVAFAGIAYGCISTFLRQIYEEYYQIFGLSRHSIFDQRTSLNKKYLFIIEAGEEPSDCLLYQSSQTP